MKNYPKVIFKYSWIYDQIWKEGWLSKGAKDYPSSKKVLNYIAKIRKVWQREEKRVIQEISKTVGLRWKAKLIDCYVVGKCSPFSHPLTMPVYEKDNNLFIDVLTHELIHNIFVQNKKKMDKVWKYFNNKYKKESIKTKHHIYLQAIHKHILLNLYGDERLKTEIKRSQKRKDYKRAWDIVHKEGYLNLIRALKKTVR
jgi:hypothetical protein